MKSFGMMFAFALTLGIFLSLPTSALAKKGGHNHLMKVCKKECPDAKDEKGVLECITAKESDEAFKQTKCYAMHEKHHHDGAHHADGAAEPEAK